MKKIKIISPDGFPLSALFGEPEMNVRGIVVISAATGVRKEFYLNFARFLVENGYRVLLYDYRGIGESANGDIKASVIYMHEWGTKDMNAVLNYLTLDRGFTDIIWLGHSIGAQLVGLLEKRDQVIKVISINAALGYWGYFPYPMRLVVWLLWHIIGPLLINIYGYGVMKKIGWGGVFNFMGNLASIIVPIVIGYLAKEGNFKPALVFIGALGLLGAISYTFVVGEIKRVGGED